MEKYAILYVTVPTVEEGERIGRVLLEERMVGCVNLIPQMRSVYWWEGKLETSSEAVLLLKTVRSNFDRVASRITELHPYEVPCVLSLPIEAGTSPYLDWLRTSLNPG